MEKDFITYEDMSKTGKASEQTRLVDMYEAFGWEVTDIKPTLSEGVTISFKRDRKLRHKNEVNKLQRKAEENYSQIKHLENSQKNAPSIFSYIFGIISVLILGGGMSMVMVNPQSTTMLVVGIVLGVVGLALCAINYPIYKKWVDKKTAQIMPLIDDAEEKLATTLENASNLVFEEE